VPDEIALIAPFIELIRGGESNVVGLVSSKLDQILPTLYNCASRTDNGVHKLVSVYAQLFDRQI